MAAWAYGVADLPELLPRVRDNTVVPHPVDDDGAPLLH
jgi:hypothetical protein